MSLLMFAIPEPKRRNVVGAARQTASFGDYVRFARVNQRFLLNLHLGIALMMVVISGMTTWTPTFFGRVHGWPMSKVGYWLGAIIAIAPIVALPLHGMITDAMFRRGIRDAHLRYMAWILLLTTPLLAFAYLAPNPWVALALFGLGQATVAAYFSVLPCALQGMVPGQFRGKAASVALLVGALAGMALGPSVVAWTTGLLGDRLLIGRAMALCNIVGLPITALFFWAALKPMREGARLPTA